MNRLLGEIVHAIVRETKPFGVFLECDRQTIFVHLPETAWFTADDRRLPTERFLVGETQVVLIYGYDHRNQQLIGSIRRAHPENDPYRALSSCETVATGKIVGEDGHFWRVEFDNGAVGRLLKAKEAVSLHVGQDVEVAPKAYLRQTTDHLSLQLVAVPASHSHNGAAHAATAAQARETGAST